MAVFWDEVKIGSRAEGEASNQSSSPKNGMCRGAYKTFSTKKGPAFNTLGAQYSASETGN
jgi:hypothetical protein